jgi:hypothetical protein
LKKKKGCEVCQEKTHGRSLEKPIFNYQNDCMQKNNYLSELNNLKPTTSAMA